MGIMDKLKETREKNLEKRAAKKAEKSELKKIEQDEFDKVYSQLELEQREKRREDAREKGRIKAKRKIEGRQPMDAESNKDDAKYHIFDSANDKRDLNLFG